jgi:quinol monooxygenase YgiN
MAFLSIASLGLRVYHRVYTTGQFGTGVNKESVMKLALFARLEAKPGKENDVVEFLGKGLGLANQESTTLMWFALRLGPSSFAIFDAFADEAGRQRHLSGPIAQALMAQAPTLFATPPAIEPLEVLGAKLPS